MAVDFNRLAEQQKSVKLFLDSNPLRSCMVLSTGYGKSKVAIDILEQLDTTRPIMILVNSTLLRDINWEAEFAQWNAKELYDTRVEMVTYQAAYKWKKQDKNLDNYFIIADEVDFAADTDNLSNFFYEYSDVQILGLTGFITDSKQAWFDANLPVIKRFTTHNAQESSLLNNIHYVFVKYNLSQNSKDIEVEYTKDGVKKTFTQSENNAYDYQNKKVGVLQGESAVIEKDFMSGKITAVEHAQKLKSIDYKIKRAVSERNELLLNCIASADMSKKIMNYYLKQDTKNKIIVFSKRTSQSNKICGENIYNGTIHKDKATENFTKFQKGEIRTLGVCDKVNRGANIPGLNIGILESFYGSDTQAVQRCGRLLRLDSSDTAIMVVLLPYYMRKNKRKDGTYSFTQQETQQVTWALRMLRSTVVKHKTIWDYRVVKT